MRFNTIFGLAALFLSGASAAMTCEECCDICKPMDSATTEFENCTGNCEAYACAGVVSRCEEFWE
ncbi:hypothetical protein SLS58_002262 [Diplodia intermedia]|uniref:Uncharacterized protein n=1 Tax=Diplodia intermedia TaxID=856260 RepID=A0ABR3U0I0_9PEZI